MKPSHYLSAALICGSLVAAFSSAAQEQTTTNAPPENITLELGNDAKMDFVLIPAGTFQMGTEDSKADETPVTKVTLTRPFYFGKYEVTQEQWQAVMGNNPSYYEGTNLPVEQVSWNAAQGFLTKLNERVWSSFRFGRFNRDFPFRSVGFRVVAVAAGE